MKIARGNERAAIAESEYIVMRLYGAQLLALLQWELLLAPMLHFACTGCERHTMGK